MINYHVLTLYPKFIFVGKILQIAETYPFNNAMFIKSDAFIRDRPIPVNSIISERTEN